MSKIFRRCFVCEKHLQDAINGNTFYDFETPPNDAVIFHTHGNYGSTIFDPNPNDGKFLEIAICDECLKNKDYLVLEVTKTQPKPKYDVKAFLP